MAEQTRGGFYISQIKQIQDRIFEKLLKDLDIADFNGPQGRILFVLWGEDRLPIRELSQKTSLAKTTLTSMLDRMESIGYLRREADPEDRRQVRIVLTEKARMLRDRYEEVSARMTAIFYRGFSEEEIARIDRELAAILENLQEYEADYGRSNARANQRAD